MNDGHVVEGNVKLLWPSFFVQVGRLVHLHQPLHSSPQVRLEPASQVQYPRKHHSAAMALICTQQTFLLPTASSCG